MNITYDERKKDFDMLYQSRSINLATLHNFNTIVYP